MNQRAPFKFDKIGYWSELKLEIIQKYGSAYVRAFKGAPRLKKFYIDAFSGAGAHVSRSTGNEIEGSPIRALKVQPPFDHYYFIDLSKRKTLHLANLCAGRSDVNIETGDATRILKTKILPLIHWDYYNRALCLLDPYGLHLDWQVIQMAGQSRAIDMFLNFPVMDMNMNAIWKMPETAPADGVDRMNRFWGDTSWKLDAYKPSKQQSLFPGDEIVEKQPNESIVEGFRKRLKTVAGFEFVPAPLPMKNSKGAVVYYLFFASSKPAANTIIGDIFASYRTRM